MLRSNSYEGRGQAPHEMVASTSCLRSSGKTAEPKYKITKPDTDNMIKLPGCRKATRRTRMTRAGFWADDAQVAGVP